MISLRYDAELTFGSIVELSKVRVRPDTRNAIAAVAGSNQLSPIDRMQAENVTGPDQGPFQSITLKSTGDVLEFRRVVQRARDPKELEQERVRPAQRNRLTMGYDLRDSNMTIRIKCPGEVITHNAHKKEADVLTWVFKLKELEQHQDRDWVIEFRCRKGGKS